MSVWGISASGFKGTMMEKNNRRTRKQDRNSRKEERMSSVDGGGKGGPSQSVFSDVNVESGSAQRHPTQKCVLLFAC